MTTDNSLTVAAFSGGRSSAAMIHLMIEQGNRPDAVIFANTGTETPETYAFIEAVIKHLDIADIFACVEYVSGRSRSGVEYWVTSIDECERGWALWEKFTETVGGLPNSQGRQCTTELKIGPSAAYVADIARDKGIDPADVERAIGMRYDEPRRVAAMRARNAAITAWLQDKPGKKLPTALNADPSQVIMPLYDAKWAQHRVLELMRTWQKDMDLPFDITDKRLRLSNCPHCFMQSDRDQVASARKYPAIWNGAAKLEQLVADRRKAKGRNHDYGPGDGTHERRVSARAEVGLPTGDRSIASMGRRYDAASIIEMAQIPEPEQLPLELGISSACDFCAIGDL